MEKDRQKRPGNRSYSDAFKQECVIRLALNKHDYEKTSAETGVSVQSLKNWEKVKYLSQKSVPELLERAISRVLMMIPDQMTPHDWAVALGILMDKWLLVQGKATSRVENLFGELEKLPDDELDRLTSEFEAAANRAPGIEVGEGEAAVEFEEDV